MKIECNDKPVFKYLLFAKKGMATKAMINNLSTGNTKRLGKQIKKGTVKVLQ